MIKTWLHGLNGRMGQEIKDELAKSKELSLIGGSGHEYFFSDSQVMNTCSQESLARGLGTADVIIDFTSQAGNQALLDAASSLEGKKFLIGSTGLNRSQRDSWKQLCKKGNSVLFAPNTSLGILLVMKLCQESSRLLNPLGFDIEILETHHRNKADAPSGTAKFLAERIADVTPLHPHYQGREGLRAKDQIGVSALRGGSVFGEHEVRFMGDSEEIAISHRALNRTLFAKGSIVLAKWVASNASLGSYHGLETISLSDLRTEA